MRLTILLGEGVRATKSESTTHPTAPGSHWQDAWPGGLCSHGSRPHYPGIARAAPALSRGHPRPEPPARRAGGRKGPAGSSAPPHRSLRSLGERDDQAASHLLAIALLRGTKSDRKATSQSIPGLSVGGGAQQRAEGAWPRTGTRGGASLSLGPLVFGSAVVLGSVATLVS